MGHCAAEPVSRFEPGWLGREGAVAIREFLGRPLHQSAPITGARPMGADTGKAHMHNETNARNMQHGQGHALLST